MSVRIGEEVFLNDEEVWLTIVGPQSPAEFMAFSEPGETVWAAVTQYVAQAAQENDLRDWLATPTVLADCFRSLTRYAESYLAQAQQA